MRIIAFIQKVHNQQEFMAYHRCTYNMDTTPSPHIVSPIGTYNYNLAKYLCNLLTLHIPTEHCPSDTFTFVHDIQGLTVHGKFMVSFDIESLYQHTSWKMHWQECIDLAVKYICDGNPDFKLAALNLRAFFPQPLLTV